VVPALDGGVYAAASAVNWAGDLGLFQGLEAISAFDAPAAIDRGIAFVPALAGLGCPHWNRAARGAWLGLSLGQSKADMMQALLEGIALRTAEVLQAMAVLHPFRGPVSVDGGLSRNPYFVQFLAEIVGLELFLPDETEQTAAGLARMAASAAGLDLPDLRPGRLLRATGIKRADRMARFSAARHAVERFAAQFSD
jgi:glycerol kinase